MVKRYLVTTSDERTWPEDKPILFLGEWCKKYSRRGYWGNVNSITVEYHWNNRDKLYTDYKYIQNLYEELLPAFSETLNKYNNTNHDIEYWRIIAGPWLSSYIAILFDRWSMIEYTLSNYELECTLILDLNNKHMVPHDMSDFNSMYINDEWNSFMYSKVIDYLGGVNVIDITVDTNKDLSKYKFNNRKSFIKQFATKLKRWFGSLTEVLGINNDVFFISSYFSTFNLWKLQIKLGQFPTIINFVPTSNLNSTLKDRDNLSINFKCNNKFEDFLIKIIPHQIPLVYLEGYKEILERVNDKYWPSNPKIILTAICYIYDDFFKIWAAEKIKQGSRLYIEQHGGHFGTGKFSSYEDHQLKISHFLSWGWVYGDLNNITPLPATKLINIQKKFKSLCDGGILLVTTEFPRYSNHLMSIPIEASQYSKYEDDQMNLVSLLNIEIRSKLTVRTFHEKFGCEQKQRWVDCFENLTLDSGENSMKKSISKNRLVVSTQNSTIMLELLAANVPTVLFWNKEHWELNSLARPYYDELRDVGILHDTPESAARHINKVWNKIDIWWTKQDTQNVRIKFCEQYAKTSDNWLNLWKLCLENL